MSLEILAVCWNIGYFILSFKNDYLTYKKQLGTKVRAVIVDYNIIF